MVLENMVLKKTFGTRDRKWQEAGAS